VGSPASDREALLLNARAAHHEHRYDAAYDALRSAQQVGTLEPDDLHRLADAAWWLGLMTDCLRLTEAAHRSFLTSGRVDRAAAQALDLGGLLAMRGEPALAAGWLGRARRLLEGQPVGPTHGILWYVDLSFALDAGSWDEADRIGGDLRRLGEEQAAEHLIALGFLGSGLATLHRGQVQEAFALLDEAALRAVGGGVAAEWTGHIYCMVVSACLDVADLDRARQAQAAAYRWLEDFQHAAMFTGVCRAHAVNLLVSEGAWTDAEQEAALVAQELAQLNVEAVAEAEYQVGECRRLRGDLTAAAVRYDRAEELGRDPQPGRALLALATGDGGTAWASICEALARNSGNPLRCARLLHAQVQIGVATGHEDAATTAARRLRDLADGFGTPGFVAWAGHASGLVALSRGLPADAVSGLREASAASRAMRSWYDAAVTDALLAEAHRLLGGSDLARECQDSATALFRRLGVKPPMLLSPPSRPDGGLTAREAEVLTRVAAGLSNREVASALAVSEATVRRHLANIFGKLGVHSRTAAAAWAHEHGLVTAHR
jgi:DNA-binding CsgD family transcriptional regulator